MTDLDSPYLESPMDQEDMMYACTPLIEVQCTDSISFPCKGCGDILEEGKAFVSASFDT
jgi:hypothetical protein